jgi:hypothetical protein
MIFTSYINTWNTVLNYKASIWVMSLRHEHKLKCDRMKKLSSAEKVPSMTMRCHTRNPEIFDIIFSQEM